MRLHLEYQNTADNTGKYIRVRASYLENGKKKTVTIFNYGRVQNDDIKRLKEIEESVKTYNETSLRIQQKIEENQAIDLEVQENGIYDNSLNLGCCFIKYALGVYEFDQLLSYTQRKHRYSYQLHRILNYLVYTSILDPNSILHAAETENRYFDTIDYGYWDLYRSLDEFYLLRDKIGARICNVNLKYFADTLALMYIDGTNTFTFTFPDNEKAWIDEFGVVREDIRQYGPSKENRFLPLISFHLLISHNGFPLRMIVEGGNVSDGTQLPVLLDLLKREVPDLGRVMIVGDSGYNSATNKFRLAGQNKSNDSNDAYLFGSSLNKQSKSLIKWLKQPTEWKNAKGKVIYTREIQEKYAKGQMNKAELENLFDVFRYKERSIVKQIEPWMRDGLSKFKVEVNLKQLFFYDPKLKALKLHRIERQLEKAQNYEKNPGKLKTVVKKLTSEYLIQDEAPIVSINEGKIQLDTDIAGNFMLETSDDISAMTGLRIYHDKFWIEYLIRTLKSEFHIRPVYMQRPEHIIAVEQFRFIGLSVIRELQQSLAYKYTIGEIIEGLQNFQCLEFEGQYVIFGKSPVIDDLEEIFGVHFNKKMKKSEILHNFSQAKIRDFWCTRSCGICDFSDLTPGLKLSSEDWNSLEDDSNIHKKEKE